MPRKRRTPSREPPSIPKLMDQSAFGPMAADTSEELSGGLRKALIERALGAESGQYSSYGSGAEKPMSITAQRNGDSAKKVPSPDGPLHSQIARGRDARFEPIPIPKHR